MICVDLALSNRLFTDSKLSLFCYRYIPRNKFSKILSKGILIFLFVMQISTCFCLLYPTGIFPETHHPRFSQKVSLTVERLRLTEIKTIFVWEYFGGGVVLGLPRISDSITIHVRFVIAVVYVYIMLPFCNASACYEWRRKACFCVCLYWHSYILLQILYHTLLIIRILCKR